MKLLSRILIIDDVLGSAKGGFNRDREAFCYRAGIQDITGDLQAETIDYPLAEVCFQSGQRVIDGYVENDVTGTLSFIKEGFVPFPRWALLLLDLHFKTGRIVDGEPEGRERDIIPGQYFGIELLRAIRNDEQLKHLPVVILSSMNREEIEHVFSELGAVDFIDKSRIDKAMLSELIDEHALVGDEAIIGASLPMLECLKEARQRARHGNDNILVIGETGTGKEMLASYIHRKSGRKGRYVPLFTQGVPEYLIEDRIFGHEKNAFTGAGSAEPGAAELADGGTLFIDEFGDISASIQTKLLRLMDTKTRETQRLGSREAKHLDLQIVMATSRMDFLLTDEFRQDLLFRAGFGQAVELPPLRFRGDDILLLAENFLRLCESRFDAVPRVISDEAKDLLLAYPWPGNVRELERAVERSVLNFRGLKILSPHHLKLGDWPKSKDGGAKTLKQPQMASRFDDSPALSLDQTRKSANALQDIIDRLRRCSMDYAEPADLLGSLPQIEAAYQTLTGKMLKAALRVVSRRTVENLEGKVLIQPAMKMLMADKGLNANQAADKVKRILQTGKDMSSLAKTDPVLSKAYEVAIRLRPSKWKKP